MDSSRERLQPITRVELWAGVECTVNRVGDTYFDQLERSGHAARLSDLNLFAELGVRAVRYPILWERTAPNGVQHADWSWADERLGRLRELHISPIVGFVHHGSGPRDTSLVDPLFPEKLAQFARAFAERYPWVERYTPVNEPLTTARFSGLYGHWYPHGRDDLTYARALITQCRAISLAMREVRKVNPHAQLVQTEDLGKTLSTPRLAYQAEFENERRWLSFDLLLGRVNPQHTMWHYLRSVGIDERELTEFLDDPCSLDLIGINHYITSERFLDERLERYPPETHGGNHQDRYADVEAVRVCSEGPAGVRALLKETWARYQLPIAVTEAHLGCTREEQLRWLKEIWDSAVELRAGEVDVRAVTAWSLLGAYDWNSLVTRADNHYESGVFDLRAPHPRPTALASMLKSLAATQDFGHPVLDTPGWWRRFDRLLYPPVNRRSSVVNSKVQRRAAKRHSKGGVLITGATGTLGKAFARICQMRGLPHCLLTRQEMDIADQKAVEATLNELQPWAVVNAAGYVRVDEAERYSDACHCENTIGPAVLAAACARHNSALLTFSSDLVFDGTKAGPYIESDSPAPLNVYGASKAAAERQVLDVLPTALVVRTSAFFGPWDQYNFVHLALRTLADGEAFIAAADAVVSPTYVPDLVHACLDLLIDGEHGLWHLANPGAITWADLARMAASMAGISAARLDARLTRDLNFVALRPLYSALGSERGVLLPPLEEAIARYFQECGVAYQGGQTLLA